jgi:hypothetical protein
MLLLLLVLLVLLLLLARPSACTHALHASKGCNEHDKRASCQLLLLLLLPHHRSMLQSRCMLAAAAACVAAAAGAFSLPGLLTVRASFGGPAGSSCRANKYEKSEISEQEQVAVPATSMFAHRLTILCTTRVKLRQRFKHNKQSNNVTCYFWSSPLVSCKGGQLFQFAALLAEAPQALLAHHFHRLSLQELKAMTNQGRVSSVGS